MRYVILGFLLLRCVRFVNNVVVAAAHGEKHCIEVCKIIIMRIY